MGNFSNRFLQQQQNPCWIYPTVIKIRKICRCCTYIHTNPSTEQSPFHCHRVRFLPDLLFLTTWLSSPSLFLLFQVKIPFPFSFHPCPHFLLSISLSLFLSLLSLPFSNFWELLYKWQIPLILQCRSFQSCFIFYSLLQELCLLYLSHIPANLLPQSDNFLV